jgi:hypothetical protein
MVIFFRLKMKAALLVPVSPKVLAQSARFASRTVLVRRRIRTMVVE